MPTANSRERPNSIGVALWTVAVAVAVGADIGSE